MWHYNLDLKNAAYSLLVNICHWYMEIQTINKTSLHTWSKITLVKSSTMLTVGKLKHTKTENEKKHMVRVIVNKLLHFLCKMFEKNQLIIVAPSSVNTNCHTLQTLYWKGVYLCAFYQAIMASPHEDMTQPILWLVRCCQHICGCLWQQLPNK